MAETEEEEKFPFDINPMYEGERVRKAGMYVELGGQGKPGYELVLFEPDPEQIKDGEVDLIGPDLEDMEEGGNYAYAMIYRVYGEQIEKDLEAVIERRNHEYQSYIQGYMHLNQRAEIWVRISKEAVKKGLKSLKQIGKATIMLFKAELPFIEKMDATFITDEEEVKKGLEEANRIYEARDVKTRGLHDEDVDEFYQCTLCQSFAPTNVCVVSPDRIALCGAMSWFDSRAAARIDPEGPNAPIPKGDCIDPIGGEYTGVNEAAVRLSSGEYDSIKLHSFLEKPHTSCGCFEVAGFYIPEVEGIGWVHRGSKVTDTPIGLPFSTIAGSVGGGKQVKGFLGIGVQYFYSPKFIQYDGGWRRVVWMASDLKARVAEAIPAEMKDKIATEKEVKTIEELREFLQRVDHPVVKGVIREVDGERITEGWAVEAEAVAAPAEVEEEVPSEAQVPLASVPLVASGANTPVRIILKDADISIGKIIVKRKEGK
ncbi:MAG: CO dehydrogenase/CO-methylating acetyl-CoA synthase complex subunit beta [Methanophagales archaeon]|nr:CO dehydrogenase/CO-methylating acetyl-CoA synthase complex subunit beta [Methanophagales archaeon]MCW3140807.1 CO dehydrogenase/CO-methylating acetyl-CoA synthase complex subunit beta [Methanophagales archaeon]